MSRIPSHLRGIKIKELREMHKRGMGREKQLLTDVLETRLLSSTTRPTLKRKPSADEASDSDGHTGLLSMDALTIAKRVFSNKSEPERSVSPVKKGVGVLARVKGKLQNARGVRPVTRGTSVSSKRGKR
jgi:hypothetical protein